MSSWFVHPGFLALAGLAAVPIAIHFLFRFRPPVVPWPAMDFLLAALRRTRRRARLNQFVLLAFRMLVVAGAAALVARPIRGGVGLRFEVGSTAEHVVVLDDTLSMGQTANGDAAFPTAVRSIGQLADRVAQGRGRSRIAVITTSRPTEHLISPTAVDPAAAASLRQLLESRTASYSSRRPDAALERAIDALGASDAQTRVLHVVGDFRRRDWPADGDAVKILRKGAEAGIHLRLVDASSDAVGNLAVESIGTASAPIAAGVPIEVEAVIKNNSDRPVDGLAVEWRLDGQPLPRSIVPSIPAAAATTVRCSITLREPGLHALSVRLPPDDLRADDERWLSLEAVDRAPTLVIDGDDRFREGRLLASALDPGGNARTGWAPTIRAIEALRQPGLDRFRLVMLAGVAEVSTDDAKALASFVAQGGALCLFVGDATTPQGWSALADSGLLPAQLRAVEAPPRRSTERGDIVAPGDFLRAVAGGATSFLQAVTIDRCFRVEERLPEGATVMLGTRDGRPLVVSKALGRGQCALILTTAGPLWNNWAANPSYVVFLLELCSRLTRPTRENGTLIGEPWELPIDPATHRRVARWASHTVGGGGQSITARTSPAGVIFAPPPTEVPGVYHLTLETVSGEAETRAKAFNIDPTEGALTKASPAVFAKPLDGLSFRMEMAGFESDEDQSQKSEAYNLVLLLLLAGLVGEQAWARRCSRHGAA